MWCARSTLKTIGTGDWCGALSLNAVPIMGTLALAIARTARRAIKANASPMPLNKKPAAPMLARPSMRNGMPILRTRSNDIEIDR